MNRARRDGLMLMLLGSIIFVLLGSALNNANHDSMVDFRVVYYPARCLLLHCDPYNESQVLQVYRAQGGDSPSDSGKIRQIVTRYIYLPTAFCFTVPFALLPWGPAHILWLLLTIACLLFASFLLWSLAADSAPVAAGALICLFLVNSELLIISTNAAGLVVSLCAVAVWCFLRQRFALAGVLCLAVALALKPQDSGLVWLYFLMAGGVYRKRALQTLLATAVLSLPALLWVWRVAPHWFHEWQSNLAAFAVHGGINDPGPASQGAHGLAMVISLQSVFSVFSGNPQIYNWASYLVCAPPLLALAFLTLRRRATPAGAWLSLASIAALTMLPVYHRQYDAKLLLLSVPACVMLWARGGLIGRLAMLVNVAGLVLTGDLTWAIFLGILHHLPLAPTGPSGWIRMALEVFPAPLMLLAMGAFYLWAYARKGRSIPDETKLEAESSSPARVTWSTQSMVGPEGFEPPTKGL